MNQSVSSAYRVFVLLNALCSRFVTCSVLNDLAVHVTPTLMLFMSAGSQLKQEAISGIRSLPTH